MTSNLALQMAIWKNARIRGLRAFLFRFSSEVGLDLAEGDVIDAHLSFQVQKKLHETLARRLADNSLQRESGLKWEEINARIELLSIQHEDERLLVFPSHYEHFAFQLSLRIIKEIARGILDFDRDTLYITTSDATKGFGIDVYTEPCSSFEQFEYDQWGWWTFMNPGAKSATSLLSACSFANGINIACCLKTLEFSPD